MATAPLRAQGASDFRNARVVSLDAAGTLIRLTRSVGAFYADAAADHGLVVDPGRVDAAFRQVWKSRPPRPEHPGPRPDDDKGWWRTLVAETFAVAGCAPVEEMFERIFVSAYARFGEPGAWELYPDAIAFLRAVPSSTRMVVASNFDRRLLGVLEACKVRARLEAVYLSSEIGADKPSPRFFEAMIAKTGCAPGEILHVGDEPQADWEGAARAGLRVYPLQRPGMLLTDLIGPADLPVPPQ